MQREILELKWFRVLQRRREKSGLKITDAALKEKARRKVWELLFPFDSRLPFEGLQTPRKLHVDELPVDAIHGLQWTEADLVPSECAHEARHGGVAHDLPH
jgi:hypothetical protein